MILASKTKGIGYAISDLVTDQAGVLGFIQSIGSILSSAGYRVNYATSIPGLVPPSAALYVYDDSGRLRASWTASGAGLPRRTAGDIASEILSDIEGGVVATVPFGISEQEKQEILYAQPAAVAINRDVNGNVYRRASTNGATNGNSVATQGAQTTAGRVTDQVMEDATAGLSFGGFEIGTTTLLIAAAIVGGLFLMGRK